MRYCLMACRGVFFALSPEDEAKLLAAHDSDAVVEIVTEEIEGRWDEEWLQEVDKSWDAIHRCLGDGSLRTDQPGVTAKAVLGGRQLSARTDWIVSYLDAGDVMRVTEALRAIDNAAFRGRYFALARSDYEGEIGEQDFEYSWAYFEDMRGFFARAAGAHRAVVFSVDQ